MNNFFTLAVLADYSILFIVFDFQIMFFFSFTRKCSLLFDHVRERSIDQSAIAQNILFDNRVGV